MTPPPKRPRRVTVTLRPFTANMLDSLTKAFDCTPQQIIRDLITVRAVQLHADPIDHLTPEQIGILKERH